MNTDAINGKVKTIKLQDKASLMKLIIYNKNLSKTGFANLDTITNSNKATLSKAK